MTRPLTLASGSLRRAELLALLGLPFDIRPPDVDETPRKDESPAAYVERLARAKAAAVAADLEAVVIAADTTVAVGGEIVGKPQDPADAARILRLIAGRTHYVLTGVAVRSRGNVESAVVVTKVSMTAMSDRDIDWYIATGETVDKAGAYAVQGVGELFVREVAGSVSNVVGLPIATVVELLRRCGVDPTADPHEGAHGLD